MVICYNNLYGGGCMEKEGFKKSLIILVIITLVSFIIHLLIINPRVIPISSISDKMNFYSTIAGGLISGGITFVGVLLTINYYRHKDIKNDRKKIKPFLIISSIDKIDKCDCQYVVFKTEEKNNSEYDTISFTIENIGLGTAIDIQVKGYRVLDKEPYERGEQERFHILKANDTDDVMIHRPEDDSDEFHQIKFVFRDIIGNEYKQNITFRMNLGPVGPDVFKINPPELTSTTKNK